MFCNRCGTTLQPDYIICPKCGQSVASAAPGAVVVRSDPNRLPRHLHILGVLWIIIGSLFLIPSIVLMALGGVSHLYIPGEVAIARTLGPLVLSVIGGIFLLLAALGVLVGWGLMKHQPWARIAAIVLGIMSLFHPPIGTALGIYTLWVLLSGDAANQYDRLATTA